MFFGISRTTRRCGKNLNLKNPWVKTRQHLVLRERTHLWNFAKLWNYELKKCSNWLFISISPRNQSTGQESLLQEYSDPVAGTSGTRHPVTQQLVQRKSQGRNKLIAWKCLGWEGYISQEKMSKDTQLPVKPWRHAETIREVTKKKIKTKNCQIVWSQEYPTLPAATAWAFPLPSQYSAESVWVKPCLTG